MLLPPELKLNIADYLDPLSSVNYGITCKEHWKVCQPIFRRHAQAFAEAPVVTAREAWKLLKDVLQDPSKGWYITEVSLNADWDGPLTIPMEDVEQFQSAARALLDLYPPLDTATEEADLVERIGTEIATKSPDSATAVLIHHLPNLKTLRMTISGHDNVFKTLLSRVAVEYVNPVKAADLPFQRLRTVSICHWDTEGCVSAEWVLPFLRVPSLRTFAANMVGGDFWRKEPSLAIPFYPHPRSNIEEFFFIDCQFAAEVVEYLISSTQALRRFTYVAGGCIVSDSPYDAKFVLKALEEHARHSLECLVLRHDPYDEEEFAFRKFCDDGEVRPAEADLTMFTQLHSLSANWTMLWPELSHYTPVPDDGAHSLGVELSCIPLDVRDLLPPSLTTLDLGGKFYGEEWDGVVGPLATLNEQTPSLTMEGIRVEGRVHGCRENEGEEGVFTVGGWDNSGEKRVFGGAERTWLKDVWAPSALFKGHGW